MRTRLYIRTDAISNERFLKFGQDLLPFSAFTAQYLWCLGLCYVGIILVALVFRWLRWYFVGSVDITLVMLAFDIWLHILVILYFTPTLFSRCNALPKRSPKKNYTKRKDRTDKRHTFLYLLGSTTIPWMREFFLNTLKWLNPPVKVSKIR